MHYDSEHIDAVLSPWFEGDLPDAERRAVDAHLRECLRCASLVRDLENIRREASRLPALVPSRDLWDGIAARIEAPVIELKTRQAAVGRSWQKAAAVVMLMAASSGVTYVLTREQGAGSSPQIVVTSDSVSAPVLDVITPRRRPSSGGGSVLVSSESSAPAIMYDQEITRLRAILETRRVDLDTATVAAVEKSLKAIDAAIIEARTALAGDAASPFLLDQLNRALDKKLGVLRRVALLPVGAS